MTAKTLARRLFQQQAPRRLCAPSIQRRQFFSVPGALSDTQTLTASRTLPYPPEALYDLIADVDSYQQFVPYCSLSKVTQWSSEDANGRKWPIQADLHVGWGGFNEAFTSRLRCVPQVSVEAVSGDPSGKGGPDASSVFKSLITRWSLQPHKSTTSPSTVVDLSIRYQFANPLYAAVSATVSDKIAGLMVEAFEKQARTRLGSPRSMRQHL
ncbi:hypothetical protein VHEMI10047 [[Torrubiella] hemipterigena]|uniref:Coenzyme Q-binding protein COQ10 START domain-containing protein n=1 Tax=[Torrubiella] hemipterigena TaxID=1531966 RepID=A0A0A1TRF7_9HYPO|nr:hypothetical protein VHEMI10047 [[Torrubiella] hemipterigena]